MAEKRKKKLQTAFTIIISMILILAVIAGICLYHFIGIAKPVGEKKYTYTQKEICIDYEDVHLYGVALIPNDDSKSKFPTVIYAHGAESTHSADMTTLKSLAKSGIACYTFDFYGWSKKSTGTQGKGKFMRGGSYEQFVLEESKDLSAVISQVKNFDFVDSDNLFLIGSSMGGCVSAITAPQFNDDLKAIILQYPAINLNEQAQDPGTQYDANGYKNPVLILQGTKDKIVPQDYSQELHEYYNADGDEQSQLIIYDGQPHVFTGKYKVQAAEDIYKFINNNLG